jgi:hypothetical protein
MAYLGNGPPTTSAAMRLLLLQKAGLVHTHEIADVNGLRAELDALAAGGGGGGGGTVVPNATTTVFGKVMLGASLAADGASATKVATMALLTSGLADKASGSHTHSEYASTSHTHAEYAASSHTHTGYAVSSHTHTEYASSAHTHSEYAGSAHSHSGYAPIASPTFTGSPKGPTPATGDSSTQLATTAFVQQSVGAAAVPNATTTVAGKVMLATIADINSTVPSNKVVTVDVLKQSNKAGIERLKRFFESNF